MFKNMHKLWAFPVQQVMLARRSNSMSRRIWSSVALLGAVIVVSLYLIVPLMIFFGGVNNLVAQLLAALLILTIGEFLIFQILLSTARSTKRNITKMQTALVNAQDRSNLPFELIVSKETEKTPVLRLQSEDSEVTEKIAIPRLQNKESDVTRKIPVPRLRGSRGYR